MFVGCEKDDTGKACKASAYAYPADPLVGEDPRLEVIRLDRDPSCSNFTCLTSQGLPPYCTRACTTDCAKGFVCATVNLVSQTLVDSAEDPNAAAPNGLTERNFCVRKTCSDTLSCGDVGNVECVPVVCYDSCPQPDDTCTFHQKLCSPLAELGCTCSTGDLDKCTKADLTCKPETPGQIWQPGSFEQTKYCFAKD